ncbi:hypothetical protein [Pseudomonas sp. PLMAX]|uniref:hypothetical protein n=1 Tax=Pseudomonas sp. PLMAX TaxID=2201998 RepID=UPI0038BB990A
MSKPKLVFAVILEPDFSKVESGEVDQYHVNVPALDFNELAQLLEKEVVSGDKVSVRCANDYLDIVTLQGAEPVLDQLSLYCKHTVGAASSKTSKFGTIDISDEWAEKIPVLDRASAPPPGILFFTVTGNSIVTVGVWMSVLHMCFGRHRSAKPDVENEPMNSALQAGFERFFGMPFRPVATVTNLGPVD